MEERIKSLLKKQKTELEENFKKEYAVYQMQLEEEKAKLLVKPSANKMLIKDRNKMNQKIEKILFQNKNLMEKHNELSIESKAKEKDKDILMTQLLKVKKHNIKLKDNLDK